MREFLSILIMPIPVLFLLIITGFLLLWRKRKRAGKVMLLVAGCWLLVISTRPIPRLLVENLEKQFSQLSDSAIKMLPDSINIIVLGGGHSDDPGLMPNDQLSTVALGRLVEGVRVYREVIGNRLSVIGVGGVIGNRLSVIGVGGVIGNRLSVIGVGGVSDNRSSLFSKYDGTTPPNTDYRLPNTKIILSGYAGRSKLSQAEVLYKTAMILGIDSTDLIMSPMPGNTKEEAVEYKRICGAKLKVIIVTDAIHMPRAMFLFKQAGLDPVPAPTNHIIKHGTVKNPWRWVPGAGNVQIMEAAVHEYGGMMWAGLGGD